MRASAKFPCIVSVSYVLCCVNRQTVQPLVTFMFRKGSATCFAYGQTGSGKTHTMSGLQQLAARDIFKMMQSKFFKSRGMVVRVSFFELYGGRCLDLLHDRAKVAIREDGAGQVVAQGLGSVEVKDCDALLEAIKRGNSARTTHRTEMNDVSSRSHAICDITVLDNKGKVVRRPAAVPHGSCLT